MELLLIIIISFLVILFIIFIDIIIDYIIYKEVNRILKDKFGDDI